MARTYLSNSAKAKQEAGFSFRRPKTHRTCRLCSIESETLGAYPRWQNLPNAWDDEYIKAFKYKDHSHTLAAMGLVAYRHWETCKTYSSYYKAMRRCKRTVGYRVETYANIIGKGWVHVACSIEHGPKTYELRFDSFDPPRGYAYVNCLTLDNSFICK